MEKIGKYEIINKLGRGGMAEVWLGKHKALQRQVAIKVLHAFLESDDSSDRRFLQEARLIASLRHPNIVQIYDFDIVDDHPFMVMEYLQNGTLQDLLREQRQRGQHRSLTESARMFEFMADALAYAHEQGAVHRDLKPANILFTDDRAPVITDFGIAKLLTSNNQLTLAGSLIGTPRYMSPEQIMDGAVDGRSDIYALGAILFEMVTGQSPFTAEQLAALLAQHINSPPRSPRQLNPNIPEAVEQVILRSLAKLPEQRFADAREMADLLVAALHGQAPVVDVMRGPATSALTLLDRTGDGEHNVVADPPANLPIDTEFTKLSTDAHDPNAPHFEIAIRYEQAGMLQQALEHYVSMGKLAQNAGLTMDAITAFHHAVEILEHEPGLRVRRCSLYLELALSLQQRDGWGSSEVDIALQSAQQQCELSSDADSYLGLLICQCLHDMGRSEAVAAHAHAHQIWQHIHQSGRHDIQAVGHLMLATTLMQIDKLPQARAHFLRGLTQHQPAATNAFSKYFSLDIGLLLRKGINQVAHLMNDEAEAGTYLQRAINLNTPSSQSFHTQSPQPMTQIRRLPPK